MDTKSTTTWQQNGHLHLNGCLMAYDHTSSISTSIFQISCSTITTKTYLRQLFSACEWHGYSSCGGCTTCRLICSAPWQCAIQNTFESVASSTTSERIFGSVLFVHIDEFQKIISFEEWWADMHSPARGLFSHMAYNLGPFMTEDAVVRCSEIC